MLEESLRLRLDELLDESDMAAEIQATALHCPVLHAALTLVNVGTLSHEDAMTRAALVLSRLRAKLMQDMLDLRSGKAMLNGESVADTWTEHDRDRLVSLACALPEPGSSLVRAALRRIHRLEGDVSERASK